MSRKVFATASMFCWVFWGEEVPSLFQLPVASERQRCNANLQQTLSMSVSRLHAMRCKAKRDVT
jgi:hypothetical protein